jgi:hypothetical protein
MANHVLYLLASMIILEQINKFYDNNINII